IIHFILHLSPDVNPYEAAADYLAAFLVVLSRMCFQSTYVLYVQSKGRKIYNIGLNAMGLIHLDHANHCGICYFLYIAIADIVCEELVQSGQLDQAWPNFILGCKLTLTFTCASVILWLCICHCALASQCMNPKVQLLPTPVKWALNTFSVIIVSLPAVPIILAFFKVTEKYQVIKTLVTDIIVDYKKSTSKCFRTKCSVAELLPQIASRSRVLRHVDQLVFYTKMGLDSYLSTCGSLLLIHVPCLFILYKDFNNQRGSDCSLNRKQKGVFANTLLEFTIILFILALIGGASSLVHKGDCIYNPSFWLIIQIIFNFQSALFLIVYSLLRTDKPHPANSNSILNVSSGLRDSKTKNYTTA
ncbi:hypothetical protein DFH28DRAFT_958618, partial [Melampsora americana]